MLKPTSAKLWTYWTPQPKVLIPNAPNEDPLHERSGIAATPSQPGKKTQMLLFKGIGRNRLRYHPRRVLGVAGYGAAASSIDASAGGDDGATESSADPSRAE